MVASLGFYLEPVSKPRLRIDKIARYGETVSERRVMGGSRTTATPEIEKPKGGRPRVPDRDALRGIIFVLRTGLPWSYLPPEMGCGAHAVGSSRASGWGAIGGWWSAPGHGSTASAGCVFAMKGVMTFIERCSI
jgi:hypothetical protein